MALATILMPSRKFNWGGTLRKITHVGADRSSQAARFPSGIHGNTEKAQLSTCQYPTCKTHSQYWMEGTKITDSNAAKFSPNRIHIIEYLLRRRNILPWNWEIVWSFHKIVVLSKTSAGPWITRIPSSIVEGAWIFLRFRSEDLNLSAYKGTWAKGIFSG